MDELKLVKKITTPQKEAAIGCDLWVSWAPLCVYDWKMYQKPPPYTMCFVWLPLHSWFLVYRGSRTVPGCKVLWVGLDRTHHIPTVLQPRDVTLATPELQPNHSSLKVTHKNSHAYFPLYAYIWHFDQHVLRVSTFIISSALVNNDSTNRVNRQYKNTYHANRTTSAIFGHSV